MSINKVIEQHAGILSAKEIGEMVGITEKAVYHRAQTMGLSLRRLGQYHQGAKIPDEIVRAAQVLYDHGGIPPSKLKTLLVGLGKTSESTIWAWVDGRNR